MMAKRINQADYERFMAQLMQDVDYTENTEWAKEAEDVSIHIRDAIVGVLHGMNKESAKVNKSNSYDDEFLNYCNAIKTLLTVYNFAYLPEEGDGGDEDKIAERLEEDKKLILTGIDRILNHVQNGIGYDITPYLPKDECLQIFRISDDVDRVVPITFSAMTVLTTLIYFRRAVKRLNMFSADKLVTENGDIMQRVVAVVAELMANIFNYATHDKNHMYCGWGVTLDTSKSKAVTLSDTYAVVDALSRYADAFTQSGLKRDKDFIEAVDAYAKQHFNIDAVSNGCINAMYKTAYNVYVNTREVYGKEKAFYVLTKRDGDNVIKYQHIGTDYDKIAASSRSSALFNPLYIAMITMYGYDDKELVIRLFMDDPKLVNAYEEKYGDEIEKYALTLSGYNDEEEGVHHDFHKEKAWLLNNKSPKSADYGTAVGEVVYENGVTLQTYYNVARVYQKYLEENQPEELMEIPVYRDYLYATKDAIDQVAVLYRDFENNQRLGVVDTDYVMFSELDIDVKRDDKVSIPKLNKANIAVNNLRPMLLSSKIMIVNALTKYPQSDMNSLYYAIKTKRHQKVEQKGREIKKTDEWLWNEDSVDMNSTARHCEAIAYDYFDYYEKYELGFAAINNVRKQLSDGVTDKSVNKSDGSFTFVSEESDDKSTKRSRLLELLIDVTRQNVDKIRVIYQNHLKEKEDQIQKLTKEKDTLVENHKKELANRDELKKQALAEAQAAHNDELNRQRNSLLMGDTLRTWIREEIDRYFERNMALAVINILNLGALLPAQLNRPVIEQLFDGRKEMVSGDFPFVEGVWSDIMADFERSGRNEEKIEQYAQEFRHAKALQDMIAIACSGLLEKEYFKNVGDDAVSGQVVSKTLEERNEIIFSTFNKIRYLSDIEYDKKQVVEQEDESSESSEND